ncbi:MAG: DUF3445 domain-containing protein [Gammaproteobacteria bacterium]|jgi:dimethylamine monooxygenase subunit A
MDPHPHTNAGPTRSVLEAVTRSAPARYFPLTSGRYEIKAGFSNLGADFGNGAADGHVFQLDRQFPRYRREKLDSRGEGLSKYFVTDRPAEGVLHGVAGLILQRLAEEHPEHFRLTALSRGWRLECALTGETLTFDRELELTAAEGKETPQPPYRSTLDALACQVQEDLAVLEQTPTGDRISALHLCLPNHWAAEDRIGDDFTSVHRPVAGFERIARQHQALVRAMIERGPYVRFAWGLATDDRLNHHPAPPPGMAADEWLGRRFDAQQPALYLRVERQTLWGLPQARSCVFTIRAYLTDCRDLSVVQIGQLRAALATMPGDSLTYKGLDRDRHAILAWLAELSS